MIHIKKINNMIAYHDVARYKSKCSEDAACMESKAWRRDTPVARTSATMVAAEAYVVTNNALVRDPIPLELQ